MHVLATKHGGRPRKILREKRVTEIPCLWVEQIEVVGWVILTGEIGPITGESQAVSRHVYLGNYLHSHIGGQTLKGRELIFGVDRKSSRLYSRHVNISY